MPALATPPIGPDDVLWSREFGGPGDERAFSLVATSDDGYAVAGFTRERINEQGLVVKTDDDGYQQWNMSYPMGINSTIFDIARAGDGGYLLAGVSLPYDAQHPDDYNALAIKTDSSGAMLWGKTYGRTGDMFTAAMDNVHGYAFAGLNGSTGTGYNAYLVRANPEGNWPLETKYGNTARAEVYDAKVIPNGGFVMAGTTNETQGGSDNMLLLKVGSDGGQEWTKTLKPASESYAESIAIVRDGYVLAGSIRSERGDYDSCLVKTDLDGNVLWMQSHGRSGDDHAKTVIITPDDGYLMAGTSETGENSSAFIYKTDADGNIEWERTFSDPSKDLALNRAVVATDGGYVLAGYVSTSDNGYDFWLVKLRGEQGTVSTTPLPTPAKECSTMLLFPIVVIGTMFIAARRR